jgi:hypothetical protein
MKPLKLYGVSVWRGDDTILNVAVARAPLCVAPTRAWAGMTVYFMYRECSREMGSLAGQAEYTGTVGYTGKG